MKKYTNKILIIAGLVFIVLFVVLTKITVNRMLEDEAVTDETGFFEEDMFENDVDGPDSVGEFISIDELE